MRTILFQEEKKQAVEAFDAAIRAAEKMAEGLREYKEMFEADFEHRSYRIAIDDLEAAIRSLGGFDASDALAELLRAAIKVDRLQD